MQTKPMFKISVLIVVTLLHLLLLYIPIKTKTGTITSLPQRFVTIRIINNKMATSSPLAVLTSQSSRVDVFKQPLAMLSDPSPMINIQLPQPKPANNTQISTNTPSVQTPSNTDHDIIMQPQENSVLPQNQSSYCIQGQILGNTNGHTQSVTMITLSVNGGGQVIKADITQSSGDPNLDQIALDEWSKCSFKPREVNGQPAPHEIYFFSGLPSYTRSSGS